MNLHQILCSKSCKFKKTQRKQEKVLKMPPSSKDCHFFHAATVLVLHPIGLTGMGIVKGKGWAMGFLALTWLQHSQRGGQLGLGTSGCTQRTTTLGGERAGNWGCAAGHVKLLPSLHHQHLTSQTHARKQLHHSSDHARKVSPSSSPRFPSPLTLGAVCLPGVVGQK